MFGLVSLNQNKVVTYMLINLYLVCLETSPPFIHRKSGRSAQEGEGSRRLMNWYTVCSDADSVPACCGEEEAEIERGAVD